MIGPRDGEGAALVLPSCDTAAMTPHPEEIAANVAPGAYPILLLDQAGRHVWKKPPVPESITLVPPPAKSPELNPTENIWRFARDNWLSNHIFKSCADITDHCRFARSRLVDMPWNYVDRLPRMGKWVMSMRTWYNDPVWAGRRETP